MIDNPPHSTEVPIIKLVGNACENFYQLGLKDKKDYFAVHEHIKEVFRPNIPVIATILEATLEQLFKRQLLPFGTLTPLMKSYAEGLGCPIEQLQLSLLLPELMSSLHAWLPSAKNFMLGCSSFFILDDDDGHLVHGRILDFPLKGSYDKTERIVSYKLKNENKIFSYSCAGFPFASVTAMNSFGITLALHQKFTNIFNINGQSIFEITHKIMSFAKSKEDVFSLLEDVETITAWNLNIGLPSGEILEIDFLGDHFVYTEHKLEKGEVLYLNNQLIERKSSYQDHIPYGLDYFNSAREKGADDIIKSLSSKKHSAKNLISLIGAHPFDIRKDALPVLTPSSVLVSTMEPSIGRSHFIKGLAPKELSHGLLEFSDVWDKLNTKDLKQNIKYTSKQKNILKAKSYLMQAQVNYDLKQFNECYHNLQMAIDLYGDDPNKEVALFYFHVIQFLLEKNKKVLANISIKIRELIPSLPGVLKDHGQLFIFRIDRILSGKSTVYIKDISHPKIKEIYHLENKIPSFMLHKIVSAATLPRIDLLDIMYLYGKL